jgi:hypothetical protein
LVATLRMLLTSITKPLRELPARLFAPLVAQAEEVPLQAQSASQRARVDVSEFAKRRPILFGAVTVAATAGCGTAAAALVSSKTTLVIHIAVAVGGAVIGFLLPVAVILLGCWLTAPTRQRNEARVELQQRIEPTDPAALADEFDAWVSARRPATPQYGGRWLNPMFDAKSPMAAVYQQQDTELANIAATTRAEYHARFRDRVRAVLDPDVTDPQTLPEVEKIAERLRAAANVELLAAHAGRLVDGTHLALLKGSIEGGIMSVLNEREVTFSDDPAGAQHNREAFTAHFPALAAELDEWQGDRGTRSAVRRRSCDRATRGREPQARLPTVRPECGCRVFHRASDPDAAAPRTPRYPLGAAELRSRRRRIPCGGGRAALITRAKVERVPALRRQVLQGG